MRRDDFWLDFLEEDMDSAVRLEMKKTLMNSSVDREIIEDVRQIKESLADEDQFIKSMEAQLDDDFFIELHDKIMARVESSAESARSGAFKRIIKVKPWSVAGITLALALILALPSKTLNQSLAQYSSSEIANEALSNPETVALLTSSQTEDEFFSDITTQNSDSLGSQSYNKIINGLSQIKE